MVDYILDRYGEGRLRPLPGSHEDAIYRQWCWFAEATLARPIGDVAQHTHVRAPEDRIPAVADDGRARALNFMRVVNDRLSEVTISAQWVFCSRHYDGVSLMLAERVGISDPSLDRLGEYFSMLKARSHYRPRLGLDQGSAGVDEGADRFAKRRSAWVALAPSPRWSSPRALAKSI